MKFVTTGCFYSVSDDCPIPDDVLARIGEFGGWMSQYVNHINIFKKVHSPKGYWTEEYLYTFDERDLPRVRRRFPHVQFGPGVLPADLRETQLSYPPDERWRYSYRSRIIADRNIATLWTLWLGGELEYRPLRGEMNFLQYFKLCEQYTSAKDPEEFAEELAPEYVPPSVPMILATNSLRGVE